MATLLRIWHNESAICADFVASPRVSPAAIEATITAPLHDIKTAKATAHALRALADNIDAYIKAKKPSNAEIATWFRDHWLSRFESRGDKYLYTILTDRIHGSQSIEATMRTIYEEHN